MLKTTDKENVHRENSFAVEKREIPDRDGFDSSQPFPLLVL